MKDSETLFRSLDFILGPWEATGKFNSREP